MVQLRRGAALLTVLTAVVVAGCSAETSSKPPIKSATSIAVRTSVSAAPGYDVSRLDQLRDDFPAGFVAVGLPSAPIEVSRQLLPAVGTSASYGQPFTVVPSQCRPLLKPVDGQVGADSMHERGDAPERRSISVGAVNPVAVVSEIPPTGCERFTYAVDDDEHPMKGTVERLTPPTMDGATTIALRYDVEGFPDVEYSYVAILDGRVYVDVQARLAPDFQAEPVLSQLLVKAVAAVAGT
jgi:hypothetical protein